MLTFSMFTYSSFPTAKTGKTTLYRDLLVLLKYRQIWIWQPRYLNSRLKGLVFTFVPSYSCLGKAKVIDQKVFLCSGGKVEF